jgi:hypothetical protein
LSFGTSQLTSRLPPQLGVLLPQPIATKIEKHTSHRSLLAIIIYVE